MATTNVSRDHSASLGGREGWTPVERKGKGHNIQVFLLLTPQFTFIIKTMRSILFLLLIKPRCGQGAKRAQAHTQTCIEVRSQARAASKPSDQYVLKGEMEQSSGEQAAQVQVPAPPLTTEEITGKFSKPF